MEPQVKSTQPELKRPAKPKRFELVKQPPERNNMSKESEDLSTHVEICAIRYEGIQKQFETVDSRLDRIDANLEDIKSMISGSKDSKFRTMVNTAGTIIVALLGVLGYMIVNLSK